MLEEGSTLSPRDRLLQLEPVLTLWPYGICLSRLQSLFLWSCLAVSTRPVASVWLVTPCKNTFNSKFAKSRQVVDLISMCRFWSNKHNGLQHNSVYKEVTLAHLSPWISRPFIDSNCLWTSKALSCSLRTCSGSESIMSSAVVTAAANRGGKEAENVYPSPARIWWSTT